MRTYTRWTGLILVVGILGVAGGCNSGQPAKVEPGQVARQKLEAMKQLADAVARDPNSSEALAAIEEFRNLPINPKENREELNEILQIYRTRVQGKVRGPAGEELAAIIASLEADARASK